MALGSPLPFGTPVIQYPGTPPPRHDLLPGRSLPRPGRARPRLAPLQGRPATRSTAPLGTGARAVDPCSAGGSNAAPNRAVRTGEGSELRNGFAKRCQVGQSENAAVLAAEKGLSHG